MFYNNHYKISFLNIQQQGNALLLTLLTMGYFGQVMRHHQRKCLKNYSKALEVGEIGHVQHKQMEQLAIVKFF